LVFAHLKEGCIIHKLEHRKRNVTQFILPDGITLLLKRLKKEKNIIMSHINRDLNPKSNSENHNSATYF
jgi:hypothetical protein